MIRNIKATDWGWVVSWCIQTPKRDEIAKAVGTDRFSVRLSTRGGELLVVKSEKPT